jgi:hypothetical protein
MPGVRRAMAELLYRHIELAREFTMLPGWQPDMFDAAAHNRLWPRPHSRIFDFEATAGHSAWIDNYAARARQQYLEHQAGVSVIGHTDWSVKHLRFVDGQVSVIYDLTPIVMNVWYDLAETVKAQMWCRGAINFALVPGHALPPGRNELRPYTTFAP